MKKIRKILIANRGEVALRIIRTCHEMGIKTVALCPKPGQEKDFLETKLADEFFYLQEEGAKGYLDGKRIIEIAKKARADAIHPGYGFLYENWRFAKLCQKNKIIFIGPHFKVLRKLEDKIEAKKAAQKVGLPILPGSDRPIRTEKDLLKWTEKIKPPFVFKAVRGGGGIGMKIINGQMNFGELFSLLLLSKRQIGRAFSDFDFFIEKCLSNVKHIEFQILGDGENFVHLGERECSIQRRFQKLLEESPSTFLSPKERGRMGEMAKKLLASLRYRGAGTVEFLVDRNSRKFYFLEVNPRLQVEHPVTEAVTGIDIVEWQIRVAQGEKIPFSQEDITLDGWAMEARILAEDPQKNFRPFPGKITKYFPPGGQGIFFHTFLYQGEEIYPYFDSLLAKLIAKGKNRKEAISKLKRALEETIIEGVPTTIPFFKVLLEDKSFQSGNFGTDFIEKSNILSKLSPQPQLTPEEMKRFQEKEIAQLVYQIYKQLYKESPSESLKGNGVSPWLMVQRLKMFEERNEI